MNKPIRVLQVLSSLDRGGAEAMIMSLYRGIDKNKVQFDFVVNESIREYAYEAEIRALGGRIFHVPRYILLNHLKYKNKWNSLLREHPEWKIIHGHHTSPAFVYLKIAKRNKRIAVAHSHIAGKEKSVKANVKVLMRLPIKNISDYLFACSEKAAKWMFGEKYKNTRILNNAVDASSFIFNNEIREKRRKELNFSDKFVIGHVGRFQTQKNHDFLIDVFNAMYKLNNNIILLLVGDGELRRPIEKKASDLGLKDNIHFAGIRSDIPELLQVMDIFLFPSLYEGLPVTLIEAQASGLKCIVSDTITNEVRITNQVEFISLNQSPEYWAEQVLKYATGYDRLNTYEMICESEYDIAENAKWLEDFYLRVEGEVE